MHLQHSFHNENQLNNPEVCFGWTIMLMSVCLLSLGRAGPFLTEESGRCTTLFVKARWCGVLFKRLGISPSSEGGKWINATPISSKAKCYPFFPIWFSQPEKSFLFVLCQVPEVLEGGKKAKKSQESLQAVWSARSVASLADMALNSWLEKYVIGLLHHWGMASKIVCFIIIHFCKFFFLNWDFPCRNLLCFIASMMSGD